MNLRDHIPATWADSLAHGPIGLGHDIATTTKGVSNWSSLAVCQHVAPLYRFSFIRWRTADPEVNLGILDLIVSDIERSGRRARRLCVDSSNEKYHAQRTRTYFRGRVPVELIGSGESVEWKGEKYNYKTLLGSLYTAGFEDNCFAICNGVWVLDDHRLVKRERGTFVADTGKDGGHADVFDAGKLAYWGVLRQASAAPGSVQAVDVGSTPQKPQRTGLKNTFLSMFSSGGPKLNA